MNILDTIVEHKRRQVAQLPQGSVSAAQLQDAMQARGEHRDFTASLRHPRAGSIALIAEVKKASPSAGVICADFEPVRIARAYEAAGASCLSVLTEEKFFQGSLEYLKAIRQAVKLPLLRKDFIFDERQLLESIQWGADAILLIVAMLADPDLEHFHQLAKAAGLAALVEVHDEMELERALGVSAELIGINNRNLKTFEVNIETSLNLIKHLPKEKPAIAESGISDVNTIVHLRRAGFKGFLIGENFMKAENPGEAFENFILNLNETKL